jgi:hypothetical protein
MTFWLFKFKVYLSFRIYSFYYLFYIFNLINSIFNSNKFIKLI